MRRRLRLLLCLLAVLTIAGPPAAAGTPPAPGTQAAASHAKMLVRQKQIVTFARRQVGILYAWGGTSRRSG